MPVSSSKPTHHKLPGFLCGHHQGAGSFRCQTIDRRGPWWQRGRWSALDPERDQARGQRPGKHRYLQREDQNVAESTGQSPETNVFMISNNLQYTKFVLSSSFQPFTLFSSFSYLPDRPSQWSKVQQGQSVCLHQWLDRGNKRELGNHPRRRTVCCRRGIPLRRRAWCLRTYQVSLWSDWRGSLWRWVGWRSPTPWRPFEWRQRWRVGQL